MTDEQVYVKHRDELMRFAAALAGPDDAADVVSTVITRILASGRRLTDLAEPRPYLMRAVLNQSRSVARSRGRESPGTLPEEGREDALPHPHVLDAVLDLPVKQRAVTFLAYWAGMTSAEIGDLLGARPATVRRYLHLAREKLKEALDG